MSSTRWISSLLCFLGGILLCQLVSCGHSDSPSSGPHGAWVSSGGELFKDANNPWFLRNTSHVRYCIRSAPGEISASDEKIDELFRKALDYWRGQFRLYDQVPARFELGIANQAFSHVDCASHPDLELLAGYGTLSPEQITYLRDPERLVSVAVRTSYDNVELRGRGFLFLSSDLGPHRMNLDYLVDKAWSHDGLLLRVLIHELGHVFGIPHVSNGIMSAQFPEFILLHSTYAYFLGTENVPRFFLPPENGYLDCKISDEARAWFGLEAGHCLYFKFPMSTEPPIRVEFYDRATAEAPGKKIGTGTWYWGHAGTVEIARGVTIYLPPDQKVFDESTYSDKDHLFLYGAPFVSVQYQLNYRREGETASRSLFLKAHPNGYELTTIRWGEVQELAYYNPSCPAISLGGIPSVRACLSP